MAASPPPPASGFEARVRESFARQPAMRLIGARMLAVSPGRCEIELPARPELTQQHGFIHGGIVGMIADNAGGFAAATLTPAEASVLTVEYKLNIVAPADGDTLLACGEVLRAGRSLLVTRAEVFALHAGRRTLCALMQQTIMAMHGKAERATEPPRAPGAE